MKRVKLGMAVVVAIGNQHLGLDACASELCLWTGRIERVTDDTAWARRVAPATGYDAPAVSSPPRQSQIRFQRRPSSPRPSSPLFGGAIAERRRCCVAHVTSKVRITGLTGLVLNQKTGG